MPPIPLRLLPILLFVPFVLAPPLNHDVAAILNFAERWHAGERLYVDLIDINPPLIFILNRAPAALAAATGLDAVVCLQFSLITLGLVSWGLTLRVRDRPSEGPIERALLDVLPGVFLFTAGYDFGQREHIVTLTALPYLLAAARRSQGASLNAALPAALLAALGILLKPYFLALPALVEAAVFLATRRIDRTPWVLAAAGLLYAAIVILLFPVYLTDIVPLARDFYLPIGQGTPLNILVKPRMIPVFALLVPLVWPALKSPAPRMLCLAAIAMLVSAMIQHRGWSYHIVPIELLTTATAALLAAQWLDHHQRETPHAAAVLVGLISLYPLCVGELPNKELLYARSEAARLTARLRQYGPHPGVLILTPDISPTFPAVNDAHARLLLPAMDTWILEGAYRTCPADGIRYRAPPDMPPAERAFLTRVVTDFTHTPPPLVVIDRVSGIPACPEPFDLLTYFLRDPGFAATWAGYRQAADIGRFRVFARVP